MHTDIQKQKQHYERIGTSYYQARQTKNHMRYKTLLWQLFFRKHKDIGFNNLELLEPMCGNADGKDIVEEHLDVKTLYHGFDYSPQFVERLQKTRPDINVHVQDITTYKPEKQYHMIILIGGLHHIPLMTGKVLGCLFEALYDGGYFISFEATQNNRFFKRLRNWIYKKNIAFEEDTEQAFDYPELQRHFLENGFTLVEQFHAGLLSYILYYNPEAFPWLNIGGKSLMKFLFKVDRLFMQSSLGAKFSFATLSLWKKST